MKYRVKISKKESYKTDKNSSSFNGTSRYTIGGRTYNENELSQRRKAYVDESRSFGKRTEDDKTTDKKPPESNPSFTAKEPNQKSSSKDKNNPQKPNFKNSALLSSMGHTALNTAKNAVSQNDDVGSSTISGVISSAAVANTYFKTIQKVTVSVYNTKNKKDANKKDSKKYKDNKSISDSIKDVKEKTKTTIVRIKKNYKYVKGMKPRRLVSEVAKKAKKKTVSFAKSELKKTGARAKKLGKWTVKSGIPGVVKGVDKASLSLAGTMSSADDMMVQGVGHIATATNYGVKTGVAAAKVTGKTIHTAAKTSKKVAKLASKTIKSLWKDGIKKTWQKVTNKAKAAAVKGAKSVVSSALSGLKKLGVKVVIPLALGIVIVALIATAVSGGASVIAYFLSGEFLFDNGDGTYTLMDIKNFLENEEHGVPVERDSEVRTVYHLTQRQLKTYVDRFENTHGEYDKVEFHIHTDKDVHNVTNKDTAMWIIDGFFYTDEALVEAIEPVFYAVLLKEYDLEPDEDEALEAFQDICDKIFDHTRKDRTEYCNGEQHSCGLIHSQYYCYNPISVVHDEYTCDVCCHYICKGHKETVCTMRDVEGHICNKNCKYETVTTLCEGCEFVCNGLDFCGGHKVCTFTWNLRDVEHYFEEYFEEPIQELEDTKNRSEEEERQLQQLKTYYEICLAYVDAN